MKILEKMQVLRSLIIAKLVNKKIQDQMILDFIYYIFSFNTAIHSS